MVATLLISLLAIALFIGPALLVLLRFGKLSATIELVNPYDPHGNYVPNVLKVIGGAQKHLMMVRGEIPFSVYGEKVMEALRRAQNRGVEITLVCGPMVVVPEEGNHPILMLVSEGILKLYYSPRAQSPHFIEADSKTLCLEEPHLPGATERHVWYFTNSEFTAPKFRNRTLAAIKSRRVIEVKSPEERFVLLTQNQLKTLQERAKVERVNLDDLSGNEIRSLLAEKE